VSTEAPSRTERATADERVVVRVWDLPVRLIHWLLVATIVVLSVTGFYIGTPALWAGSGSSAYLMGKMHAVHIGAGWAFTALLIARVAWMFLGNRWARWDQFLPLNRERLRLSRDSVAYYAFLRREPPAVIGHNPLAGLTYLVLFTMFAVQAITGFALEALEDPDGLMWRLTGWVFKVAPIPEVRLVHHLVMWLTAGFVVHHVYSSVLVDREERSGLVSSMVTGNKSIPKERMGGDEADGRP
jgi:Ni/Fe-hydrogenase 1 B-type cytochrome subunit